MASEHRLRVAVFVGTRADLGPLAPVIEALDSSPDVGLDILTGLAYSADELEQLLPKTGTEWLDRIHCVAPPLDRVDQTNVVNQGSVISRGTTDILTACRTEVLVVLGDRWELLYVVPPAFFLAIPIVHIHGGEVTEGAIDERIRHAITKIADLHCVASADAAARLHQLGEPDDRVHLTGAPGLDRLAEAAALDDTELADLFGSETSRPLALFTYHPATAVSRAPVGQWALEAAEATLENCGTVIATYPGMDEGRDEIIAALTRLAAREPRLVFVESLGHSFPRVLRSVDVVVGNSSAGIIEAGSVPTPVVDIGDRQRGRLRGANVISAQEGRAAVSKALETALSPSFVAQTSTVVNPYGDGHASSRILEVIRKAAVTPRMKRFVDLAPEIK